MEIFECLRHPAVGRLSDSWRSFSAIYIRPGFTDMRKAINGLALMAQDEMKLNIFEGNVFIFCGKRKRSLKVLYWDRNGFCLWQKRLEKDRYVWPKTEEQAQPHIGQLNATNVALEKVTAKKYEENIKLRSEIKNVKYLVAYFKALKFARSSEKLPPADQKQLFDEAEIVFDKRLQTV